MVQKKGRSNRYSLLSKGLAACMLACTAGSALGTVTVNGDATQDSNAFVAGKTGMGSIVAAGGIINTGGIGAGIQATGIGTITVTDPRTAIYCTNLTLGSAGSGTMYVLNGAAAIASGVELASQAGSTGYLEISGSDSILKGMGALEIGENGDGTLVISNGATVNNSGAYYNGQKFGELGLYAGSTGKVIVTGAGSNWIGTQSISVGVKGHGEMTVEDGGVVTTGYLRASLSDLHGNGTINVTSGFGLDADIVYDATHGLSQTIGFGNGGSLNLTLDGTTTLCVGVTQTGTLRIADGVTVASAYGLLGNTVTGNGVAVVTGAGSKWSITNSLTVGSSGTGSLTVTDGGVVNTGMLYADLNDLHGNGVINTNGAVLDYNYVFDGVHSPPSALSFGDGGTLNISWSDSSILGVGYENNGSLLISNGQKVRSQSGILAYKTGSSASAKVTGDDSQWVTQGDIYIGKAGPATLLVEDGGAISAGARLLIGASSDVTVTGEGTSLSAGSFSSAGNVLIANGAKVTSGQGAIGRSGTPAVLRVTGDGTTLTIATTSGSGISVSNGEFYIEDGAQVVSSIAAVGDAANSLGKAMVSGAGSSWTINRGFAFGTNGNGILTIDNQGTVNVLGELNVYHKTESAIQLVDGTLRAKIVYLDDTSQLQWTRGIFTLTGGSMTIRNGPLVVSNQGTLRGTSYINSEVVLTDQAHLAPGDGLGTLGVGRTSSTYGLTCGQTTSLDFELGGTATGQYDLLKIAGLVSLDGYLDIHWVNGYVPNIGDSWIILDNDGVDKIVGRFANGVNSGLGYDLLSIHGATYRLDYNVGELPNNLQLTVVAVPEPAGIAMIGLGLLPLLGRRQKAI